MTAMLLNPDLQADLKRHLRGELRTDLATRILYSTDASIYQIEPLGVAFPRTQDDLHAAVELAAKYEVPILPRGAGSSLAGQAIGEALILDCSRWLDNLVEIDPEARTATVEPGLVLAKLNAAAAKYGLTFGPDPASAERATMGGVIGNNATGAHSILYGMTADHLLSADVIQADGSLATWGVIKPSAVSCQPSAVVTAAMEIREKYADAIKQNYPRTWRNSAGYRLNYLLPWSPSAPPQWVGDAYPANLKPETFNLAHLLAGSEGTLAVMRRATVNLVPKPKYTILGVLAYDSVIEACEDVPRLLEFKPSAIELIPQMLIRLAKGVPAYAHQVGWVPGDPAALLVVEFSGSRLEVLKEALQSLGPHVIAAESTAEQADVWSVRKVGLGIFDSRPADIRPVAFIEDCAIPVERLGEFVREVDKVLAAHNTVAAYYAHASAGCLHIRPMLDMKRGARALRPIAEAVLALTLRLGGAMSSEHGDGIARGEFLKQTYGAELVEAMRILKQAADPHNLLNPGKMLDAPPMDTRLRYDEGYTAQAWNPALDFERNNGLGRAIEQCNGQGVCRDDSGVMCPSFQVTREEGDSTRGRANLLRALISSQQSAVSGQQSSIQNRKSETENAVFQALDLCLACKGCKAECPSGVDMAKLKYEFQHEYYKSHRRKLRDYLFAYIGPLTRLGAPFGGLANRMMSWRSVKKVVDSIFGLAGKRELPKFSVIANGAQRSAANSSQNGKLFRRHKKTVSRNPAELWRGNDAVEKILLLRDTFTHFFEPEIEQAALEVLAACGVEVKILPFFGAGRTLLSKGFIEPARRHAERILEAVGELDPEGNLPVLGIEPSELYTLRDEFLDLLPTRRAEAESLAARAWLVDEWLVRPDDSRKLRVANIIRMLQNPQSEIENRKSKIVNRESKIENRKSEIGNQKSSIVNRQSSIVDPKSKIHLHGHCYQKAQPPAADGFPIGQAASAELLQAVGYDVQIIPSGCCGMAGAFGYEDEHYELSMQVGELVLFPEIRERRTGSGERGAGSGEDVISAPGTSCRAQIVDGTGVRAEHPLVLVARRLRAAKNTDSG